MSKGYWIGDWHRKNVQNDVLLQQLEDVLLFGLSSRASLFLDPNETFPLHR
jgi:hypothetical protein